MQNLTQITPGALSDCAARRSQGRNFSVFVVPPVLQENDLISRSSSRRFTFARQRDFCVWLI